METRIFSDGVGGGVYGGALFARYAVGRRRWSTGATRSALGAVTVLAALTYAGGSGGRIVDFGIPIRRFRL